MKKLITSVIYITPKLRSCIAECCVYFVVLFGGQQVNSYNKVIYEYAAARWVISHCIECVYTVSV